jgi:hypothetical protein
VDLLEDCEKSASDDPGWIEGSLANTFVDVGAVRLLSGLGSLLLLTSWGCSLLSSFLLLGWGLSTGWSLAGSGWSLLGSFWSHLELRDGFEK